jgi:hypothetical protein
MKRKTKRSLRMDSAKGLIRGSSGSKSWTAGQCLPKIDT